MDVARIGVLSLLLTLFCGGSSARFAATAQEPADTSEGRTVIAMQMDYGKPAVMVTINGQGPWPFLVDSGAGVTIINQELARQLNLPIVGQQKLGDPADPEAIDADMVRIETIAVGDTTFRQVEVASWDRSNLYKGTKKPQGVLGIELFADYLLTFDYPSKEISMRKGELTGEDRKETIPYSVKYGNIPTIQLTLAGKEMDAHFDTGSPAGLTVPTALEKTLTLNGPARVVGKARTVNSEFEIKSVQLNGTLLIGGHTFKDPQVIFADVLDDINAANIGSGLLREFVLTFDQKNRLVRLHRP